MKFTPLTDIATAIAKKEKSAMMVQKEKKIKSPQNKQKNQENKTFSKYRDRYQNKDYKQNYT